MATLKWTSSIRQPTHLYHLKSVRVKTLKINLIKLCENEISTDGHQSSASPGAGNVPDSGTIETDWDLLKTINEFESFMISYRDETKLFVWIWIGRWRMKHIASFWLFFSSLPSPFSQLVGTREEIEPNLIGCVWDRIMWESRCASVIASLWIKK